MVVVVSDGGGLMQRLILNIKTKQPLQQSNVRRSELIALRKICGRLLCNCSSSSAILFRTVEVRQP